MKKDSKYYCTIVVSEQKPHKQFDSTRIEVCYASYHSCIPNEAVISHSSCVFINNFLINNKLIITLTPSDAGDNNESAGIKKSFWPKIGVTIVVSYGDDMPVAYKCLCL